MLDYDFNILHPNEFECLTRDLLQKKEGVFVESFTNGRDEGIDLRFASIRGKNSIIQCKRYGDFKTLKQALKKEVAKVNKLAPSRYILSTSVGLTPQNKETIKSLFAGFIRTTEDILGRQDLNNLLGQYRDVEKQYYKLWLGSTTVLEGVINKRIENWSGFELEEIRREVSTYVMNDSFDDALKVLKENHYVIISGIPGIGKTTLARMLVYHLLARDYEEFIKVSTMDDAFQKFSDESKQVFYFDDFLGSNFFDVKETGFEGKFLLFVQKVKRSHDKLFILSTREYVLSAARREYEKFELKNIEMAKCTIELSKYSEDIRARILYSHLVDAALPFRYIEALLEDHRYLKIVRHQNFNPRIIEAFLLKEQYKSTTPEDFVATFLDFFDRPYSVWEYAFLHFPLLSQNALFVLLSMGGCAYLKDWDVALKAFVKGTYDDLHLEITEQSWKEMVEVLQGTFIVPKQSRDGVIVEFHNPSVYDFLLESLKALPQTQLWIIDNAVFSDQLLNVFTDKEKIAGDYDRIRIPLEWSPHIIAAINRDSEKRICAKLEQGLNYFSRKHLNKAEYLIEVQNRFPITIRNNPFILSEKISESFICDSSIDIKDRVDLLAVVDEKLCGIDISRIITNLFNDIDWTNQLSAFLRLIKEKHISSSYIESDEFNLKVCSIVEDEIDSLNSEEDGAYLKDEIADIYDCYTDIDIGYLYDLIDAKIQKDPPEEEDVDEDWAREAYYRSRSRVVGETYEEMFTSLLDK